MHPNCRSAAQCVIVDILKGLICMIYDIDGIGHLALILCNCEHYLESKKAIYILIPIHVAECHEQNVSLKGLLQVL